MPWYFWIPIAIIAVSLLFLGTVFLLSRIKGGLYLQKTVLFLSRWSVLRRFFQRMSESALEKQNPELASAVKKMRAFGEPTTPEQAQRALSLLTPAERKAYMAAVGEQMPTALAATNRQQRRQVERGGVPTVQVRQRAKGGKKRR